MFAADDYAACSPLSFYFFSEGLTLFEHSSSGETYFSASEEPLKNFRWLDLFSSKKFDNNALFHAK